MWLCETKKSSGQHLQSESTKKSNISDCRSLKTLPVELGNIKSLTEISAWRLDFSKFPDSIRHIVKLAELDSSNDENLKTPFSSSSDLTPTLWDVFLSFGGSDTRLKFVRHLYSALNRHGVRAFMDSPELRSGTSISEALVQAIHESKCYIVVLSKNYASSRLCLDELVEIYICHRKMKKLIIPVFYHINPSDVRYQTGSFGKAFEKYHHISAGEMERVDKWRIILKEVADCPGHLACEHRYLNHLTLPKSHNTRGLD